MAAVEEAVLMSVGLLAPEVLVVAATEQLQVLVLTALLILEVAPVAVLLLAGLKVVMVTLAVLELLLCPISINKG